MTASLYRPKCAPQRQPLPARIFTPAALVCVFVAATGCSHRPASVSVPLKFRPTSQLKMGAFAGDIPDSRLFVAPVADRRDAKDTVGENVEEDKPVPVVAADDPAQFTHDQLVDLLTKSGVQMAAERAQADRILQTELNSFWVKETSTYDSEIRTTFVLTDRTGKQLWKGTINGTAKRFGRSLSPENYQEVFSDGLVDLVQNLLSNSKFRESLGKTPGA